MTKKPKIKVYKDKDVERVSTFWMDNDIENSKVKDDSEIPKPISIDPESNLRINEGNSFSNDFYENVNENSYYKNMNSEIKKIDGKYTKKKKALERSESSKSNIKGLKFHNPSQRNHSSVYE